MIALFNISGVRGNTMKDHLLSFDEFRQRKRRVLRLMLVPLLLASPVIANAMGNLLVSPTRVVFEQRDRTAQVTLVNQGRETGEFRITFIRQNMLESGEFVPVADDEPGMYSDTLIRYSPRQVTLPPGQSQVIRLMLRKPRDLADGEYRSHLLFQALPPAASSSIENIAKDTSAEGITVEITPIVGVSIPVIVRHGKLDGKVSLSDARIVPAAAAGGSPAFAVTINRSGNSSVYGDIRATFTPSGGAPLVVAQANGVAVYANIDKRHFQSPLKLPSGVSLANGILDVALIASGENPESGTLAHTSLTLR